MTYGYFFTAKAWKNWYRPPALRWWIQPSGTAKPWTWTDYIKTPIAAQPLGALIAFAFGMLVTGGDVWASWAFQIFGGFYGQVQKADALLPTGGYNVRNMFWRTLLAAIPIGPLLWWAL